MPVEPIDDSSIKIRPTKKLRAFFQAHLKNAKETPENISAFKKGNKNSQATLNYTDVLWLKEFLDNYRNESKEKVYLHELLENAEVELPTPKVTPRNPELEARVQKLIAQQNEREYKAMTRSVDSVQKTFPEDTIAYQLKLMNKQLIAVAQFVFSVLAGFAFGFVGVELMVGNLDFGFRLLLGIICALTVALAEIYFLAIKLNEDSDFISHPVPTKLHQE